MFNNHIKNMQKIFLIILLSLGSRMMETVKLYNYELIIFEGSDWCASCRKFEKTILGDSVVKAFIKTNHLYLIKADFPQRKRMSEIEKRRNQELAEKYQFKGVFPTIILATDTSFVELKAARLNATEFVQLLKIEMEKLK